jgi:hypothetical protein
VRNPVDRRGTTDAVSEPLAELRGRREHGKLARRVKPREPPRRAGTDVPHAADLSSRDASDCERRVPSEGRFDGLAHPIANPEHGHADRERLLVPDPESRHGHLDRG